MELSHPSNLSVGTSAFVNASADDYRLAVGAAAIDVGVAIGDVTVDRDGTPRPQGNAYDVGGYEWRPAVLTNVPPSVMLTSPSDGLVLTAPPTFSVTADASDVDGTIADVAFYSNGQLLVLDPSTPYAVTVAAPAAGAYTFWAIASDNLGASATSPAVRVTVLAPSPITLSARGYKVRGLQKVALTWTPGTGSVNVQRDGTVIATTPHDGEYVDDLNRKSGSSFVYKVCTIGQPIAVCSNESSVTF
jgi:hypothetical protein